MYSIAAGSFRQQYINNNNTHYNATHDDMSDKKKLEKVQISMVL